ncbi:hypothetical protein GHA01_14360 [Novacetimonas hansenii]|uniref:Uncharacterized protein n=1 Tax=Novacetimonas hansenii TaxID=436 RepID=A0ABQ0SEL8_NOVHA|nr:hypothetical protein Gaha_0094_018 [Novacetimonas hansenii JCM 7643]GEC63587.1 hypothetical protein GHA01_14360 [Novacetimonas hansenii]
MWAKFGDENLFPCPMDAQGHDIIHDVIFARDTVKDLADHGFLFRDRDVAETEIGRARGRAAWCCASGRGWGGLGVVAIVAHDREI